MKIVKESLQVTPEEVIFFEDPGINVVCEVKTKDLGSLIVRVNTDPDRVAVLEFQAQLMDKVRAAGIPVPEVLHYGNTIIPAAYLIYKKVEGITGDSYTGDTTPLWYQIGSYTSVLHTIKGEEYGKVSFWSGRGTELYKTWSDFVYARIQSLSTAREGMLRQGVDELFLNDVFALIEEMNEWEVESSLIHGDLALKNVVLNQEGGAIASIIDWDEAHYARAPHFDIPAVFLFTFPTQRHAFAEGYGLSPREWGDLLHEMKPVIIYYLFNHLVWFMHSDQPVSFKETYWRLHEVLAL